MSDEEIYEPTPEEQAWADRAFDGDVDAAVDNPCLYCGLDDLEIPYEDTDSHRETSLHQWSVFNS